MHYRVEVVADVDVIGDVVADEEETLVPARCAMLRTLPVIRLSMPITL